MSGNVIVAGLGLALLGFGGRYMLRQISHVAKNMQEAVKLFQKIDANNAAGSKRKFYKGGFESKMSRNEAALILGISPHANKAKVKEAFKKVMAVNHPDRGGSPYMAAKINEAKNYLEKN